MGGHSGGEVASRVAVDAVAAHLHEIFAQEPTPPAHDTRAGALISAAVQHANQAVCSAAQRTLKVDMGTTVACVLARGDRAAVAHVGDSRVYRFRDNRLETLTDDHSLVAECVRSGYLPPGLASIFPYRHLVTRSLGADDEVEVDVRVLEPMPGDTLLLCTDGLCGVLEEDEIGGVLGGVRDLGEAARVLVDGANEKGGPDNVTVVLARWL
jgi:protein phosphatase